MSYDTITQTFTGIAAVHVNCWCGVAFAVPRTLYDEYRRQHDEKVFKAISLYCPLGHSMVPAGESPVQKELRTTKASLEYYKTAEADARRAKEQAQRQAAAARGQVTRIKKRVAKGVCPCCKRYFADLHRHMSGQHPEWKADHSGASR